MRSTCLLATLAVFGLACDGNPVGMKCFLGKPPANPDQPVIASPSLDCASRECLYVPLERTLPSGGQHVALCTADCERDDDCDGVEGSPCLTGFTCAVPQVVGPFCCRKQCICRDYVQIPSGGIPLPSACDPADPRNTCCNLPGREDQAGCGA